jgi:hypothetical protein
LVEISEALHALDQVNPLRIAGRVAEVTGLVVRATIPGVRVGEMVTIDVDALPGVLAGQARLACRPRSSAFAATKSCSCRWARSRASDPIRW